MIEKLNFINSPLKEYVEETLLPQYNKNEQAHGIEHINYVIRRSFELIEQNNLNVDYNKVYAIAAYHDIGHYIDPKKHEIISAKIMSEDENLKQYFSDEDLIIIKEAIQDHRASSDHEPRSIYGKIISSADRNNTVEQCLERSYYYGKRLNPEFTDMELYERAFKHLNLKFKIVDYKYKILQTGKDTYQDMLLHMYNLKNVPDYKYSYDELINILDEYYTVIFDKDYKVQYILENNK